MAPTDRAPYYHGLRVHLQIVMWKMLGDSDTELKLDDWGWCWGGNQLLPIMTDMDVAHENLLKRGTNVYICRKHGLKCVSTCGNVLGKL